MKLAELENVRVSLTLQGRILDDPKGVGAVLLGTLTLGTVVIDAVAPSRGFRSLAWLLPHECVYVRPIRGSNAPPPAPGEWLYADAWIDWIDWPGVYLREGQMWIARKR